MSLSEGSHFNFRIFFIGFILTLLSHLFFRITLVSADAQEFFCLNVPLLLAGTALFLILLHAVVRKNNWVLIHRTTMAILLISMIWSGTMGILYDYRYHREQRRFNLEVATLASESISDNAIVFTDQVDAVAHLMESGKVRIASPFNDKFRDFDELVAFHLQKENDVFWAFHSITWRKLQKLGLLNNYEIKYFEKSEILILGQVIGILEPS